MTGEPDFNFPAFYTAAAQLRALGHEPINPADNDHADMVISLRLARAKQGKPGHTWVDYMRRDLRRIADADAVLALPGWWRSRGASIEIGLAGALGWPVYALTPDGQLELYYLPNRAPL